jgi:hypothetical protein
MISSLKTSGLRGYFRERLQDRWPEQADAHAVVFCYIPDALIGAGVINERNTVGCFSSHGLFVVVFLNEFRERFCERVRAIGEELRNQSPQVLAGCITKRSPCRLFPLRKPLGKAGWFCHHIFCDHTQSIIKIWAG